MISAEISKPEGAMIASTNQVLMQTATVTVKNRKHSSSTSVRLILDSGSQRSYITQKLAKELKLTLDQSEKLSVVTLGSSRPKSIGCRQGSLSLFLKDGSTMPMNVTVVPSITGKINRVPLKEEDMHFLKGEFAEGKLLTMSSSIEMLIGIDYYFDLLEPRKMDMSGGLSLFHSKLGWIFGGRVEQPPVIHSESSKHCWISPRCYQTHYAHAD